jgi:hypothetical protein
VEVGWNYLGDKGVEVRINGGGLVELLLTGCVVASDEEV